MRDIFHAPLQEPVGYLSDGQEFLTHSFIHSLGTNLHNFVLKHKYLEGWDELSEMRLIRGRNLSLFNIEESN